MRVLHMQANLFKFCGFGYSGPMQPRKLHTTGRTSTRMSEGDIAALKTALASHAPTPEFLTEKPLEVELGIGNGLALLARARANPEWHFLGSEIYLNGLEILTRQLAKTPAGNLRITRGDARDLPARLPARSVSRLLVLFPDPWPKSRHHKRRLVQTELLDAAARVLKSEAELWVVTDWPDYAFHTIATVYGHPSFMLDLANLQAAACKGKLNGASPVDTDAPLAPGLLAQPPVWWVPTKYQQKADRAGRQPWFLCARRRSEDAK